MNPQKIGRYEILSELGRGGMATVYKAYDPRFEREVALKVLPREMLHDPQFRVRFEREAKTIAALEHSSIVPVYDVGEEDGQPYFVMRYMTGGSLAERIRDSALTLQAAAHIMERMGSALDEAHQKGIVHRDLKPGNILFDRSNEPYVSDFGIAKISSGAATVTGAAIIGTPAYMSPEQAQGEKVDGRSDIYALGVILYEMLSGVQPYQADTPMAIVVKHITEPVPHILDINPNLPTGVEAVIEKAMAKNRDERFATAGEFAAALSAVARGESAEQAIQTASIAATQIQQSGKTRLSGKPVAPPTKVSTKGGQPADAPTVAAAATPSGGGISMPVILGIGAVILALLAGSGYFVFSSFFASPKPTATQAATLEPTATQETAPTLPPTENAAPTETVAPIIPTLEPSPSPTQEQEQSFPGGADKVAFIANNNVWIMNLDGSKLTQLTNDNAPKSNLQWMDDKTLVFLSTKNINTVDAETGRFDTIASFPYAATLDAFRVSPDGKTVAIGLNHEMYIVPLDIEKLRKARGKSDLIAMKGCLSYTGATQAAVAVNDFRWADTNKQIAWMFAGVAAGDPRSVDLIRYVDISQCDAQKIKLLDEFPGTRFTMEGYGSNPFIPDFDFDGIALFVLNSYIRNNGWGNLYTYNLELRKANQLNPIGPAGTCCYRDARWSPDKNYLFFAFQDRSGGANAQTQFYYIPFAAIDSGTIFTPIPMPDGFFKNPKEAPQPALHAVLPSP